MSTTPETPERPESDVIRDIVSFDELAARAGAALRRPAPADGVDQIAELRRHQRVVRASIAGGVAVALLIGGWVVAARDDGEGLQPADSTPDDTVDLSNLRTTFVSPRNGFSIKHPDDVTVTPATQRWGISQQPDGAFDVVDTGSAAVFKGVSREVNYDYIANKRVSLGRWFDDTIAADDHMTPDGCGVRRDEQAEITIDGRSGRVSECPHLIEASVVAEGRIYLFTLSHDRSDARAVFDAFASTIDLTPETAVDFPAFTSTFVSPTYGFSFDYIDRGGLAPAQERWDPVNERAESDFNRAVDAVETGFAAYFEAASVELPDGVAIDEWVDEYVFPGGCRVPRSEQAEITIDGHPGRISECPNQIEATVVVDGRLSLFVLEHNRKDARAFFDAWVATIELIPSQSVEVVEAGDLPGYPWPRFSPSGSLLAVQSFDSNVLIHDAATLTLLRELPCPTSLEALPESAGTAPSRDYVWDLAAAAQWDDESLSIFKLPRRDLCGVSMSVDGSRAVTEADLQGDAPRYGRSLLWDTSDGSLVARIEGSAIFAADGATLMVDNGSSISLADGSTGAVLTSTTFDTSITALSPDGRRMAGWSRSYDADGNALPATIYDTESLTPVATLSTRSPDDVLGFVDFVFDDTNTRVATFDVRGVTIWDASTGAELQRIPIQFDYSVYEGHGGAFSSGGAMFAVPQEGHITIFDSSTGAQLADLEVDEWIVPHTVEFSADGSTLIAAVQVEGTDETDIRVWSYAPAD